MNTELMNTELMNTELMNTELMNSETILVLHTKEEHNPPLPGFISTQVFKYRQ